VDTGGLDPETVATPGIFVDRVVVAQAHPAEEVA
jgi:acyl CoA:acetate/3-ketoacid CoA transferase alpha subunit